MSCPGFYFLVKIMNSVKIPQCPADITKEWLKEALSLNGNKKVEVLKLAPVKEKNGFLSEACKAEVVINGHTKNLFIKTIVGQDDNFRALFYGGKFDEIEINFYKNLLPSLCSFSQG